MGLPRREDFLIKEIPALHPLSQDYISYWREQKRRCILGYWVGGTWMPPALYYYVNFHTIRLNETLDSNSKTFARPYLRDLEWNFFLHYTEARGFSGFQDDDLFSCHRVLLDEAVSIATLKRRFPNTISSSGEKKIYVPARSYMTQVFPCPMGKPLFENSLQNIMMLGSRDSGKSYSVAGLIAHNFLFDGATDYDEQLIVKPAPTELIVGAEKSDKSTDLLKKVRDAFDFLPGKQSLNDKTYPSPFAKRYKGSWEPNKEIIAEYKKKIKGTWTATGSKSSIKHRTFNTDAYAAQGTRPLMLVLEECFAPNTKFLDQNFNIIEAKNIQVGTTLIGPDGKPTVVKEQWTGESTMYRISPKYAESFEITGKHLLYLEPNNYLKKTFPDPIKVSVEEYLTWATYKRNNYQIPISTTVDFEEKELPIDPYLLGLWLGDGESRSGNIYNSDQELVEYLTPIASKITQVRDTTTYAFKVEGLANVLATHGLKNNKHIPEIYSKNSRQNRLNMLAGLIDSDGYYVKDRVTPSFEISSYITLGYDIINLCRSLGFRVTYKLYKKYMRILIRGKNLSEIPTKLVRKQAEDKYYSNLNLSPFKVEKLDVGEYVGFTVDNNTSNVLLADYTVVSNCGMFQSLKEVYTNTVDNLRRGMRKTGMLMMLGCVCAGTKVWTHDGRYVNIEDLNQEDGILGYAGIGVTKEPIMHMNPPAKKPCFRITTAKGNTIECSEDHPLLWSKNHKEKAGRKLVTFKRARDIKVGDQLMSLRQVPSFGTQRIKNPRLLGLLLGDGNYTKGSSPSLSIEGEEIFSWVKDNYSDFGISKEKLTKKGTTYRQLYFRNLVGQLKELEMYGQSWEKKQLPINLHEADLYSISEFLGGYFDSDGSVYVNKKKKATRIVLTCKYKHLLEGVKHLLYKLSVGCSIVKEFRKGGFKAGDIYRLYINKNEDILQFKKHIKLLDRHKQDLLDLFKDVKSRSVYNNCYFEINPENNKGTYFIKDNQLDGLESNTVVSIEDIGEQDVYNLNAGITHTYITNGFISGNTGGDMESGTLAAAEMFYEPNKYDILSMPDIYENRGQIGYFIPAYITLDEFKDDNGETDIEASKADLIRVRKTMETGSSYALSKEMQYRPIVPSEMFLTKTANIFPTVELRRRLSEVQVHSIYDNLEKKVDLFFDPSSPYNGVSYELNSRLEAITTFPYEGDAREGAVVIYEFPQTIDDRVPSDAYIIGCDPFRDDSQTGQSLASIYVMKTSKYLSSFGYDEIVAEYVGRPYLGKNAVNETLHKLSLFYGGAKIYFENAVGNVKDYFEKVRKLELLAKQPVTVFNRKAAIDSGPQVIYGYPMSNQKIKWEALQYLRMWLLEERSDGKRNLDLINSPSLLQELINFNMDGNFDRVMGLVGCIVGLEELRNLERRRMYSREETSQIRKDFERLIVNNPRLFNAKFSKTTAILHGEI